MRSKMSDQPVQTVLVNGASGKLGRQVVARAAGFNVVKATRHRDRIEAGTIHIDSGGNVDPKDLADIDVVINCAGAVKAPNVEVRQANVAHVAKLAAAARASGVGAFVQVSSFSVYGDVEEIGAATRPEPTSVYGQSKYDAERILSDLDHAAFRTVSVRLPFMFDAQNPALLRPLIRAFGVLPAFPLTQPEVVRSMIAYPDAADALLAASASLCRGNICVADPTPFTFSILARLMREAGRAPPALFVLPEFTRKMAFAIARPVANRLLKSSLLLSEANWCGHQTMQAGLELEIIRILSK